MDMSVLSKNDLTLLLEISYEAAACYDEESFKSLVLKLQDLIIFKYANVIYADIEKISSSPQMAAYQIKINYPEELISTYYKKNQHLRDHVVHDFFKTFQIQNCKEIEKRHSLLSWKDVVYTAREFGIRDGFVYGVRDLNQIHSTCFTFLGPKTENDERAKTIIEFSVPFLSVAAKRIIKPEEKAKVFSITTREIEVMKWLKQGKTSWGISKILNISDSTVRFHINNIKRKLNAENTTHAIAIAFESGLFEL